MSFQVILEMFKCLNLKLCDLISSQQIKTRTLLTNELKLIVKDICVTCLNTLLEPEARTSKLIFVQFYVFLIKGGQVEPYCNQFCSGVRNIIQG